MKANYHEKKVGRKFYFIAMRAFEIIISIAQVISVQTYIEQNELTIKKTEVKDDAKYINGDR